MTLAETIEVMASCGCTVDQVAIMSRAFAKEDEERKNATRTLSRVRQQKRRRALSRPPTVTDRGDNVIEIAHRVTQVTRDERDAEGVLPKVSLNNNNKTLPNPSPESLPNPSPRRASSRKSSAQGHLLDPEPLRLLAEKWNELTLGNPELNLVTEIDERSLREKNCRRTLAKIIRDGMDAPTAIAAYIDRIGASDWLMGRSGSFIADFDWIVDPEKCSLVLGGRYENRQAKPKVGGPGGSWSGHGRELAGSRIGFSQVGRGPVRD